MSSLTKSLTVENKLGLHARAAAQLAQSASRFKCEILLEKDGVQVNAKSVMGILTLAASQGTIINFRAVGSDAQAALDFLENLFRNRFGEE